MPIAFLGGSRAHQPYIHACMHTYIHTYVRTYIHTYMYIGRIYRRYTPGLPKIHVGEPRGCLSKFEGHTKLTKLPGDLSKHLTGS